MKHRWSKAHWCQLAKCVTASVYSPALSQSVVAEMQDELVKRVWLLSDLLLFLLLQFGLRFLDKPMLVNTGAQARGLNIKSPIYFL